jgi:hypothetical protein
VKIDLHLATLPALAPVRDLVLPRSSAMSRHSSNDLRHLSPHLVLHVPADYLHDSSNNHATFDPHLVLHHVPRQSGRRRRRIRRGRRRLRLRLRRRDPLAPPPVAIVVAIRRPPRPVRATVTLALALVSIACVLSCTDPSVRQEPAATYRARALLSHLPRIARRRSTRWWSNSHEHPRVTSHERCRSACLRRRRQACDRVAGPRPLSRRLPV